MTPKEKSIEMINKMLMIIEEEGNTDCRRKLQIARRCALIAVDEILMYNTFWDKKIANRPEDTEEFWIEVKLEIEKL